MNPIVIDSVMLSQRGRTLFVISGYKFRFQKRFADGTERWTCCKDKCKCFVKVNEKKQVIDNFTQHNHDKTCESVLNRQKFSNSVKRKAMDDPCEQPIKLLHRELIKADVPTLTSYDTTLIRNNIYHARAANALNKYPERTQESTEVEPQLLPTFEAEDNQSTHPSTSYQQQAPSDKSSDSVREIDAPLLAVSDTDSEVDSSDVHRRGEGMPGSCRANNGGPLLESIHEKKLEALRLQLKHAEEEREERRAIHQLEVQHKTAIHQMEVEQRRAIHKLEMEITMERLRQEKLKTGLLLEKRNKS